MIDLMEAFLHVSQRWRLQVTWALICHLKQQIKKVASKIVISEELGCVIQIQNGDLDDVLDILNEASLSNSISNRNSQQR